jgi:hypothetical protein
MAKKQIEPVSVSAPSADEMIKAGRRGTKRLGTAAADTNVSGRVTQLGGLLELLGSGGAMALDPRLRAEFDSISSSVAQSTRAPLAKISQIESQIARLQAKGTLKPNEQSKLSKLQEQLGQQRSVVDAENARLTNFQNTKMAGAPTAMDQLRKSFPELQQTLDDAEPWLAKQGQLGASGERLMQALGQGYQANEITARDVGRGAVGESLYNRAAQMAQSDGRLSPEATRDAVQSARQAFSARGLGTSAGGAAAELLNRDQYSRQRMFQDLGFASGIQESDVARQTNNANRALQAATSNEEARRMGNQMNIGMLGQAFTTDRMVNQEGLGAALQRGQLRSAANPANMLLSMYGSGEPTGSQALPVAGGLANTWATNALNANMFNANSQMWANAANQYGNYGPQQSGSGMGSTIGSIAGGVLGGAAGYFASGGNPLFAMGGYTAGSQIGGGVGGQFG